MASGIVPRISKRCHCIFYGLFLFVVPVFGFLQQTLESNRLTENRSRERFRRSQNTAPASSIVSNNYLHGTSGDTANANTDNRDNDDNDDDDIGSSLLPLMKLASAHCASQALNTAVRLKIPDILGENQYSIEELCDAIAGKKCNKDALLRTMRLLTTIDIVREEQHFADGSFCFSLTKLGKCLRTTTTANGRTKPSMASCIQHWMEEPLWDSWLGLPAYIEEGSTSMLPFERANNGISSDFWYNKEDHPESLRHANDFVRLIHDQEINAVVNFDWSFCRGKRLVDIGGHNGLLIAAIAEKEPSIDCYCLDLEDVILNAPKPETVTMVPGNVFDPNTIPPCDVILMKHFCDRCMWNEAETVDILRSCSSALSQNGTIVIADAVLPDCGLVNETNELALYLDALYMLVGRERQRTKKEWEKLADLADLDIICVESTNVPSCSLIVLEKRS